MRGKPVWTEEWLRENGYEVYVPRPDPAPRPVDATKPAGELRRGDEIRNAVGQWVSVADVQVGDDGRVRIMVAGWKLFGWFLANLPIAISPRTWKQWEQDPRRLVVRGRDLVAQVLTSYFPDDITHEGALAHANNITGALGEVPPQELVDVIAESLEAKGLPRPIARVAARRCQVAWLMGLGGH